MDRSHYAVLADLFLYPDGRQAERVAGVQAMLEAKYPEAADILRPFTERVPKFDLYEAEELFTRSFDVQSLTTLDVGYVLFGDDYKRGELLANLNREHNRLGIDCGHELADHLPNLLKLVAVIEEGELLQDLIGEIIHPALTQMISEFDPERISRKNELYRKHYKTLIETHADGSTVYLFPLEALDLVLRRDFAVTERPAKVVTNDFLRSMDAELTIERNASP